MATTQKIVSELLPFSVEELVLNIERQAREFALEGIAIPELRFRQMVALAPLTTKQDDVKKDLKANTAARARAPKKELGKLRDEEMKLLKDANDIKEDLKTKRAELGIAVQITAAKAVVDAHKWRRMEQLTAAGVQPRAEPLPKEEADVEAYQQFKAAQKLLSKLKNRAL